VADNPAQNPWETAGVAESNPWERDVPVKAEQGMVGEGS